MQKKYFFIICLTLFIISMAAVSASDMGQTDGNTDMITISDDDVVGDGVDSGTFGELQEKINNADEGSTIELFNNYTYDDTFHTDGILINKSLTIEGNGFTIDGANQSRIFFINATNEIVLNNIVFANGLSDLGGAIFFNQSVDEVTIANSVFANNAGYNNNSAGGAIVFNNKTFEVLFENSTFENNYAKYGGSVMFIGDASFIEFKGCSFRTNKAHENNIIGGGAIYFIKNVVFSLINNCEFDNLTANTGGAIHFEKNFVISMINNTKFTNNKAYTKNTKYGGGAISIEGNANLSFIENCEFINNSATTHGGAIKVMGDTQVLIINNTLFDGNYAPYAGALCLKGGEGLTIIETEFTNNKGTDADIIGGGAIYVIGNLTDSSIQNTEFENNSARSGGAIYVEENLNNTIFINNHFTNNSAFTKNTEYGGGAIAVQGNATNNKFNKTTFSSNTATTHGGAIKFMKNDENNTFMDCIFIDNYAPYGGAIAVSNNSKRINLTSCTFKMTKKTPEDIIGGGAIYIIGNMRILYITDCLFESFTTRSGGAIYIEGDLDNSIINSTYFINNKATTNNTYYGGGAINVEGNAQYLIITESNFINNTAKTHGGAIKLRGNNTIIGIFSSTFDENYAPYAGGISLGNTKLLIISDTTFTNNRGTDADIVGGGAIYVIGNLTNAVIVKTEFINNSARAGGAIYVEEIMDNSAFADTYFINNTAFTNNTEYGGGAIAVQGNATNNKFNGLTFTLNSGSTHGGTVNFMENAINNTFVECEFLNNNGRYGSDIAVNKNTENLNISRCNFSSYNEAAHEVIGGGALYFINNVTNINISECSFTNYTSRAGGAIFFEKRTEKSAIEDCLFENNEITTANMKYGGGAIFFENDAIDFIIRNCEFINNTASTKGGAISINNAENVLIDGVLFHKNTGENGRAVYLNDGHDVTIQNSEFIGNEGIGTDICYNGNIISRLINSTFNGTNHIFAGENSILTLSNNKELDQYLNGDYFIYNEGGLYLENNTLSNVIYNNGIILTPTTMTTLFNETINTTESFVYLNAHCEDDNGNTIVSEYGIFHINDKDIKVFFNEKILEENTFLTKHGSYLVDATTYGILYDCNQKYSIINYNPKKEAIINASDIELNPGQYGEIKVELPENATGTVIANVDGEEYIALVKYGKATIIIPPLAAGEYKTIIHYSGDDNYESNYTSCLVTVLDKISVAAPDVTKYYHGSEKFVVNVTQTGKAVANASVEITINSESYTRQTDENGIASIDLNLESGNYTATVKVEDVSVNSTVTVLPTVNGSDVTKVYRNGTQYYATFLDSEGNYLKEGTNVTFNINGVFYNRTISNQGLAKLNINLEVGEYIITVINPITAEKTTNTITVISKITENKDITKYYRNATQYTATILGDNGKPVGAGETVKFNINGVFYERQTNESGQVKLNINLQPGDYIITAEHNGCMVSNNVKVLPVLTAENLTKKYGTPDAFEAKLVDGQGNAYANQKVEFNINGIFYNCTTDSNGIAKLNINLQAGEYIITSAYNECTISNKITVIA